MMERREFIEMLLAGSAGALLLPPGTAEPLPLVERWDRGQSDWLSCRFEALRVGESFRRRDPQTRRILGESGERIWSVVSAPRPLGADNWVLDAFPSDPIDLSDLWLGEKPLPDRRRAGERARPGLGSVLGL